MGDSKTATSNNAGWPEMLDALISATDWCYFDHVPAVMGVSGATAVYWAANIDVALSTYTPTPTVIAVNVGVNDASLGTSEADFKTALAYVLDAFHAKYPSASIGVAHVWKRNYAAQCANINTWIDTVRGGARAAWTFAGPDETTWLENGDDGAAYTSDGVHYNAAGAAENAAQWKAVAGL